MTNQFEHEVIDRLARIETKLDSDFRALNGVDGKPGLIDRVSSLEENRSNFKFTIGVIAWIIAISLSIWANLKK